MFVEQYEAAVMYAARCHSKSSILEAIAFARKYLWYDSVVPQSAVTTTAQLAGWHDQSRKALREAIRLGRIKSKYMKRCKTCNEEFIVLRSRDAHCSDGCANEDYKKKRRLQHRRNQS